MTKPSQFAFLAVCVMAFVMTVYESAQARLLLDTNISVGGIYTDNLFFSETNKTETFGVTVGPQLGLNYTSPDIIVGLIYSGVGQIFPDENGANRYIQSTSSFLDLPFLTKRIKGLEVRLIENFTFTPSLDGFGELDQPGITLSNPGLGAGGVGVGGAGVGGTGATGTGTGFTGVGGNTSGVAGIGNQGLQIQRTNALRNLAGVNLRYLWNRNFTITGGYRNLLTIFTEDGFRNSTINTVTAGAVYNWFLSPNTTTNLSYNFFPTISDISAPIFQHQIGVGGRHQFNPTWFLNGTVGVSIIQTDPTQIFANLNLSKIYDGGTLSAAYRQQTGLAQGFANSATLTQNVAVTLTHGLTERLTGFLQLNGARNNSLSGNDLDVLSYGGTAGLNIALLQWLSGSVSYNYFKQENQGGTFGVDTDRNFVSLFLTAFADPTKILE